MPYEGVAWHVANAKALEIHSRVKIPTGNTCKNIAGMKYCTFSALYCILSEHSMIFSPY